MEEPSWLDRTRGYIDIGMLDEAAREIENLSAEKRGTPEAQEMRIIVTLERGHLDEAFALSEVLCDLHPKNHAGFIQGAYCLHAKGETEEAIEFLQSGPETLRDESVYFYNLACYDLALGKEQSALTWLKESIAMNPVEKMRAKDDPELSKLIPKLEE